MDSAYFLLTSLEVLDDERNFVRKADMFTKRTIKQKTVVTSVDTASEALAVSLAERACVDLGFMASLMGGGDKIPQVVEDLKGVIFKDPNTGPFDIEDGGTDWYKGWQTADEYLSGNVREKLADAKRAAETDPAFQVNVEALEQVQPTDLNASEISVQLGSTWLPPDVVEQFVFELLDTSANCQEKIHVHFSRYTGAWNVEGKSVDRVNVKANSTYGTTRINAYKIIEDTLNLRDVRIFDYVQDRDGKRVAVLNKKETAIAQGKQELIKQAFQDWIWKDPARRERLTKLYNVKFNSIRPREYDGSHLNFVGINPEITLRPHQVNAIAHILYGGNTLLAHVVGAGKTFEMVAAAQESKRLGLCQKSLFVVPNHLTEQWASEYLQLYPSANILVATKKDFETKNRKRFCGRIATGDYDAIIIGHSQFEKIPMSVDRQRYILEQQRRDILEGIAELKAARGDRFSVKQMERAKKTIDAKLEKLNDQSRKDDVVTFEELGVDRIFIDEAHYYKNLAAFSKMRNVGGISQTEAQKSSDLYMKCRYLDELTGGRGVIFATGTPISNTMVEMYTMQKYLQYGLLGEKELLHFDAWASTFGETVTAIELAPEVDIYTYVTENTFDSYLYQLVEGKQKFIGQIMTSKSPVRSAEDIDETALSYAEIKALCTGNPHIKEKMDLDIDVQRLKLLKANHLSQRYALEDQIIKYLPKEIAYFEQHIEGYTADMNRLKENTHPNEDGFSPMEVEGTVYTDKKAAGSAILAACKAMTSPDPVPLGQYRGFAMELSFESFSKEFRITLKGTLTHTTGLGTDIFGNILRLDNLLGGMEERLVACREQLENVNVQLANAKQEVEKPFPQEDELKTKSARLDELNILLNMDKRESEIVDGEPGEDAPAAGRDEPEPER